MCSPVISNYSRSGRFCRWTCNCVRRIRSVSLHFSSSCGFCCRLHRSLCLAYLRHFCFLFRIPVIRAVSLFTRPASGLQNNGKETSFHPSYLFNGHHPGIWDYIPSCTTTAGSSGNIMHTERIHRLSSCTVHFCQ